MKVTYDEKMNNDFTPFRLILEFETSKELKVFYTLIQLGHPSEILRDDAVPYQNDEREMFEQIHDAIILKKSK